MVQKDLVWLVLGFPLLGWLIQSLFGARIAKSMGKPAAGLISVIAVAAAFAVGLLLTVQLAGLPPEARGVVATAFDWISLWNIRIPVELRIDTLSMTMVLVITGIGSLIHLYSMGYMSEEPEYPRFFSYLNLFVAFMLVLVLGNNLPLLFIGWEGVGLCSYLLIGFWYKDFANSKAANKAFIVNRIGDVGLVIGMFLILVLAFDHQALFKGDARWLSYDVLIPALPEMLHNNGAMATAIALCLFVGACGKSAQFPLYLWLPDAMAGPTPVSALIHAATMVTSGVVLLNRMQVVFAASPTASAIVAIIGCFTAVFAALIAFGQSDIKKVLAYSTVSQLGFMFIACGVGAYWVGMYHVITHAFFKALLFLGSGAVIHAMAHEQDMRHYGNLRKYIPITFITMVIGWIAIAGVPFTSGWFSKEEILHKSFGNELAVIGGVNVGVAIGFIGFFAALLTAIYMTRMMMLTFWSGEERWKLIPATEHGHHHQEEHHAHGSAHADHENHGPDTHGFFFTDEELHAKHEGDHHDDHHHALDANHKPHEVPATMWIPLVVLSVFSLLGGIWLTDKFGLFGHKGMLLEHWLDNPLNHVASHGAAHGGDHGAHEIPYANLVSILGYSIGLIGMVLGTLYYFGRLPKAEGWDFAKWAPWRRAARDQFCYDQIMVDAAVDGGGAVGDCLWHTVDEKGVDGGVNGIAKTLQFFAGIFRKSIDGFARSYALMMLFGVALFVGYLVFVLMSRGSIQ